LKKIIINDELWQTRVAVVENNRLQDIYFDNLDSPEIEKCFFKGKVAKVLPGVQSAFIEIGQEKAGFMHISEVDNNLAMERFIEQNDVVSDEKKGEAKPISRRETMNISKVFSQGQEVLVQIKKEPISTKGAKLTTCFALPGKFVVLMPNIPQVGVSRKISDDAERKRLREVVTSVLPEEMGVIVRTDAEGRTSDEVKQDLSSLISTWSGILEKFESAEVGDKVYQELPVTLRAIREHLDDDTQEILCDSKRSYDQLKKFIGTFTPEAVKRLEYHQTGDLFFEHKIDKQIEDLLSRKVNLKSGGSLIIEATEAMTVIDVNTGRFVGKSDADETILKTNLEAAEESVRQLRVRGIGGIIIIDFIDMSTEAHREKLSSFLQDVLKKKDRYRSVTLSVSAFGTVQMTRKRSGKSLAQQLSRTCSDCYGLGLKKTVETNTIFVLRGIKKYVGEKKGFSGKLEVTVSEEVFNYLSGDKRASLLYLSKDLGIECVLCCDDQKEGPEYKIKRV
jgi:ribonuclease G